MSKKLLTLGYDVDKARREAVQALRKAELETVHRKAKDGVWKDAKGKAKEYKRKADAWQEKAEKWKDGKPDSEIRQLPQYVHCYANPVRQAQYAKGFVDKVKRMAEETEEKGAKGKTKRRIHLVHSSKGGCGKTFTAITYAMYLAFKHSHGERDKGKLTGFAENPKHEHQEDQNRVLLIDCDFRGAGVEAQLLETFYRPEWKDYEDSYRDEQKAYRPDERSVKNGRLICVKKAPEFFNRCMIRNEPPYPDACISKMRMYRDMEKLEGKEKDVLETHGQFMPDQKLKIGFDVMFSESSADAKRAFLANSSRLDGSIVNCAYFKHSFKKMLAGMLDTHPQYTDIIIDMSPGIDEYVDCIIDACLSGEFAGDNRVILHAVTTSDVAHMRAMEEYLINTIAHRHFRQHEYREIRLIINEVRRYYWDGNFDEMDKRGNRTSYGDKGGRKGTANAETIAKEIISRLNKSVNNPYRWLEVYSQLFMEEYTFDNLNTRVVDGKIKIGKHAITDVFMALCPYMNPDKELEAYEKKAEERNRRFDLPLLFWQLGDDDVMIDPNAPNLAGS